MIIEKCAICFESLNNLYFNKWNRLHLGKSALPKQKKKTTLICSHTFHQKCIKKWFKESTTCPLCRK